MTRTASRPARLAIVAVAVAAAAVSIATGANAAASAQAGMKPVIEMKTANLGKVIATDKKLGIYYWDTEKTAKGKIKCTGACAVEWPPVYVTGGIPKHLKGVMATLGTIKRGARLQLTVNGLPAYTYKGDTAGVVECDGVDGWHAVKA
jgi:predicted lipoprotein with Yx(FWY)xxD motif